MTQVILVPETNTKVIIDDNGFTYTVPYNSNVPDENNIETISMSARTKEITIEDKLGNIYLSQNANVINTAIAQQNAVSNNSDTQASSDSMPTSSTLMTILGGILFLYIMT